MCPQEAAIDLRKRDAPTTGFAKVV